MEGRGKPCHQGWPRAGKDYRRRPRRLFATRPV